MEKGIPYNVPKGDLLVRRFAMLALSLSLMLGLTGLQHLFAQGDAKKDTPAADSKSKKDEVPAKPEAAKTEPAKAGLPKPEAAATAPVEPVLAPIPPEVEAKLEAARKAVAEAIVAAEDAGLVKTTIDPPPILDILITGRANDEATLKARRGASPEVFGAWWSGSGKTTSGLVAKDVRIIRPEDGLKTLFEQRTAVLSKYIEAARKAKGTPAKPATEPAKAETKKAETKKEETKKDQPKAEESKKAETKKEETKKEATPK